MSDPIKHECGIAFIRLLKPLEFYQEKYGSPLYGLKKLYLMMEKQHNRGQDGAGVATIKLNVDPGKRYISRQRSNSNQPIADVFAKINAHFEKLSPEQRKNTEFLRQEIPFIGDLLLGHLRYGTYAKNTIEQVHPFLRQNNWMSRNLVLAGNFNMTNVDELFKILIELGQHPKERSDSVTMLEKIGHFLDAENQSLFDQFKSQGLNNIEISEKIAEEIQIPAILKKAFKHVDGGYAMVGMIGHGDAFIMRDPSGIRPAFFYQDDEVLVVASERPAIMTGFNVKLEDIKEINPGNALIVKRNGQIFQESILDPLPSTPCSFERIYFSRGNDSDIYKERKKLGYLLAEKVLSKVNYDFNNTVFSYIPNTAATSFYGMIDGTHAYLKEFVKNEILNAGPSITPEKINELLSLKPRREKIAVKDAKLRTFITDDTHRDDLVAHVYDVTYGIVKTGDTLVVIDDSIVRGTTLKRSILRILDRLGPKKIIVVSSAPQIRYPDCYGIDMSKMGEFVAFQALINLLKQKGLDQELQKAYQKGLKQLELPKEEQVNVVQELYDLVSTDEITAEISRIVTPTEIKAEVELIFQSIENLHLACPNHKGDWYFTGNYPTPGGIRVVNKAFINYMEGRNERGY